MAPSSRSVRQSFRRLKNKAKKLFTRSPKLKFYYGWFYKHAKVVPNRMLLESFHGKNISDSPLAVLEELIETGEYANYEIFFATDDMARDKRFVQDNQLPVKLVDISTRRYTWVLATAKYLLNNSSFPAYFIRRPEQNYVQTWHGTPLKTLGKRMRLGIESMYNVQHNFIQAKYLTFPNDFTRDAIMRDYNLEDLYTGTVAMLGYPRNSIFLKGENAQLRRKCGLEGYQTFAYMPTWRGRSNHDVAIEAYKEELDAILAKIDASLRDDQKMFVNLHSMVASKVPLESYEHIFPFPETVGNYDFLSQVDVLITDYSSVFFDFALTGKPIILFAYDLEDYLKDRGFYFPIEELPFPLVKTTEELTALMHDGAIALDASAAEAFAQKYLSYDSVDNSARVIDLLLERNLEDIPCIDYSHNKTKEWGVLDAGTYPTLGDVDAAFRDIDADNEILVLMRTKFSAAYSEHVHDNYRDACNYVFVTRTCPRTFIEEALSRVSQSTRDVLAAREKQRVFGDLNITNTRSTFCVVERGSAWLTDAAANTPVEVQGGEREVVVSIKDAPGTLERVFLSDKRTIVWCRDCTPAERESNTITLEVGEILADLEAPLTRNSRRVVGASFVAESGDRIISSFEEVRAHAPGADEDLTHYLGPVILHPSDYDFEKLGQDVRFKQSMLYKNPESDIVVTPYFSRTGKLSLFTTYAGQSASSYLKATLVRARTPGQRRATIKAKMPVGSYTVRGVVLINREEMAGQYIELPYTMHTQGSWHIFDIAFDPNDYEFNGVYWDVAIIVDDGHGYLSRIYIETSKAYLYRTTLGNDQCVLDDGNVLFPYTAKGPKLAFIHRQLTEDDTMLRRVKEIAAFGIFAVLHPYWKRKRMWLVYEKFCANAQDNAFRFFEYCMNDAPAEARKFIYYVIDKDSPDYENVKKYGRNVVDFMSFRHMLYCMVAKIYVASDSRSHLYQWRPKPSIIRRRIGKHKIFFLQHGVTAMKRVDRYFGAKGTSPMTYFLATSEREQEIIRDNFGYTYDTAPVLGFSRWDVLDDQSDPAKPTILIMPTWRSWLEEQPDEFFLASEYFATYSALVKSPELSAMLERHDAQAQFVLHPKLSEYLGHFAADLPRIEFVDTSTKPINELIMECSMLVTDYSSVAWDVLYMNKPVVYYQFDQDTYNRDIGSYIDFDSELPGVLAKNEADCVRGIESYIENNFAMSEQDQMRADIFLPRRDKENRSRTYRFLVGEGF